MNWFTKLRNWIRPGRRKRRGQRLAHGAIAVPRQPRSRADNRLPRFHAAATEPEAGAIARNATEGARLSQAFTPAQPVSDLRRFAGRSDLVERIIRTIEDRRMHVVVHGDRGMGKTSLLHILAILAGEARYLVRYTSCSEDSEFDEVFRSIAADIRLLYHREYDPTSPEAEKGLSIADTFSDRPLTPTSLSEAFAKLAGTRLLLLLDEFDRVSSPHFRKSVAELIKNLSDRSARVQIVIGGVATNLAELVEHIPSIRRNVLGIQVGPMSEEELGQIIDNAQAIARIRFEPEARERLLASSNGSPYLVNLIGQQAGRAALNRDTSDISAVDVETSIMQIEGELRSRLSPAALKQLTTLEKALTPEVLRDIGCYAHMHFGALLPQQSETVASSLTRGLDEQWWDEAGDFRFSDDSIPVILWLTNLAPAASHLPNTAAAVR